MNLVLFSHSYYSVLFCSKKRKNLLFTTTPVQVQLPSAWPLFLLPLTPLTPPTNRAPPTRLTLLTPLHGTTHPCPHEARPYPSNSFLPAILTSAAALSTPPASSPFLS